ncbi:Uncharacterised protein [Candidatus Gugararchaeum adminiculabundum]|nr:Uncharacterised protein [Candidatus Gugararchaeum adminiculabundum]
MKSNNRAIAGIPAILVFLLASFTFAALAPPPFPDEGAGSLLVTVSGESGAPIEGASISLSCSPPVSFSQKTNSSGSALFAEVSGNCLISAESGEQTANASISIASGETASLKLTLRPPSTPDFIPLIFFILVSLAVIFTVIWYGKKILLNMKTDFEKSAAREEKEEKFEISPEEQAELAEPEPPATAGAAKVIRTKKMSDIIKTLEEKQAAIVEYLISHGGKARQSKVRYDLRIPKTTFFRLTRALENRNIIKQEKYLNTAEISLSDWFLSAK